MTTAQNLVALHDGGSKNQAAQQAENQSVWQEQDYANEVTIFGFADGSALFMSGPEVREATAEEIEAAK